jgi:energy-coupling factor transporter ATP-binding protein EcfA2
MRLNGKPVQPWKKPGSLTRYHYQDPDLQLFATRVAAQWPPQSERFASIFGLTAFANEHPLDLPYVLRKRLAIGCAIASSTPLIAVDEPTLGQDDAAANALHRICCSRAGLVISHSKVFRDLPEICLEKEVQ